MRTPAAIAFTSAVLFVAASSLSLSAVADGAHVMGDAPPGSGVRTA